MTQTPVTAVKIFFSYSHRDEELRDELAKHLSLLKRQGVIQEWHDRKIDAGQEWRTQIDEHLERASIILLLVSADFLASDYCYDVEMARAMKRHEAREACVIPVILRPVIWQDAPFGKLQALPKSAQPVTSWANRDAAFTDVAEGVKKAVLALKLEVQTDPPNPIPPVPPWWKRALWVPTVAGVLFIFGIMLLAYYVWLRPVVRVKSDRYTKVYIDNRLVGETTDDGILSRRVGFGQHRVELIKEGYDAYKEIRQFGLRKTVRITYYFAESGPEDVDFRKFDEERANDLWVIPEASVPKIDPIGARLHLENLGLIFPEKYNYGDFKMILPLRLTNARGAAWAVRVKDESNYYLFYLAGPGNEAVDPGFYFYIVRNNNFAPKVYERYLRSQIAENLIPGGQYEVLVAAVGNKIHNCIRPVADVVNNIIPPDAGKVLSLGVLVDKDNRFPKGSIGFRTVGSEKFSIGLLHLEPAGQQVLDENTCDFQPKGQVPSPPN